MSGLASLNRYWQFEWAVGAPQPGELEYLGGCAPCRTNHSRGSLNGAAPYNRGPQPWANGYYRRYAKL